MFDLDCFYGAGLTAGVTADADVVIYVVLFMGRKWNCVYGAALCAAGTPDTAIGDFVLDELFAPFGRAFACNVSLVFATEVLECGKDRIGCGAAKSAETAFFDLFAELFEGAEIFCCR